MVFFRGCKDTENQESERFFKAGPAGMLFHLFQHKTADIRAGVSKFAE
jgi:hypothetical protein